MEDLFKISLYLYDSSQANGLGAEIPNVLIGGKITTCLDDTLDTAEVTIDLSDRKEAYKPLTKMVLVLSKGSDTKYFHYEVRSDLVEKLSMSDAKYKHTLFLGNPAISCQKRTCDNFSISYRLQDVTLEADKFSDSLVVNPSPQGTVVGDSVYKLLNSNYAFVDEVSYLYDKASYEVEKAVMQRQSRVFNWVQYDWAFTYKQTTYEGYQLTDYRLASTTNFKTNLEKMNYYSVFDKASGGLTTEQISKLNKWMDTYHSDKKLQVIGYQSDKDYSTNIDGSSKNYFEKNTAVNGTTMPFVVPQLLAYNSIANKGYTSVSVDKNDYVMLPTLTTIKKTSKTTGDITYRYYVSAYGSQNTTVSAKNYYQSRRNSSSPQYAIIIPNAVGLPLAVTNDYINSAANTAIVMDNFTYTNPLNGKVDTCYSPVYLSSDNTFANGNNIINIEIEENCVYEITVNGYFGEKNQPSQYNGPTIKRQGIYAQAIVNPQTGFKGEFVDLSQHLTDNVISTTSFTSIEYNDYKLNFDISHQSYFAKGTDFKWSVAFETIDIELGSKVAILKQYTTKPTCYDLFLKAQICSQTKTFDKEDTWASVPSKLPYTTNYEAEMKQRTIIEDTYQNKNLWEIFMQIGKYMHAKPYIEFSGDRYMLSFKEYGSIEQHTDEETKDTLFNSYDIESYISSLDNYIENYFEYGNEITEYLRPTDNDGTSVCSTDNAVLKTKYAIMEIVKLEIVKSGQRYDMTDFVFEHNIYKLLPILSIAATTSGLDTTYTHYRGNSIYYHKYGTQITGFQYKEPSANNDKAYAIKVAIYTVLANNNALGSITSAANVHINDFVFKITYRTRDDARFKSFKPDLRKFIRNADNDLYPYQAQFNNQLDRIVDSAKFGSNTYGTLLRSGNEQLSESEYITKLSSLKDSGDLYIKNDNLFYVVKNTMVVYPNNIECEVEYSKDYNKLSEIIGIDSEPRFYEIPEDKTVKRNVAIDNFFLIKENFDVPSGTKSISSMDSQILQTINSAATRQPKFAYTRFSNVGSNADTKDFSKVVVVPCMCYASGNTLTVEWDMQDNFGAGDNQIDVSSEYAAMYKNSSYMAQVFSTFGISYSSTGETTFTTANSIQYCDVYGKCDIVNFFFVSSSLDYSLVPSVIKSMPDVNVNDGIYSSLSQNCSGNYIQKSDYSKYDTKSGSYFDDNNVGYIINKDARETIGINVSYHLITDTDRIIIANNIWRPKLKDDGSAVQFYIAALSNEISKYSRDTITGNTILEYKEHDFGGTTAWFEMHFYPGNYLSDNALNSAKSIAIIYNVQTLYQFNFVIARNVSDLTLEEKKTYLHIVKVWSDYFKTKED